MTQETDMNTQESKISNLELTTEDLDDVSGGLRSNQTEAWAAFKAGIVKGLLETGATVTCVATP
jgi:hypothetical protein